MYFIHKYDNHLIENNFIEYSLTRVQKFAIAILISRFLIWHNGNLQNKRTGVIIFGFK